eukprot:UC4_evm1s1276
MYRSIPVRAVQNINRCGLGKSETNLSEPDLLVADGINFKELWKVAESEDGITLDVHSLAANSMWAMLETYGVEAARETIIQEITRVFKVYGIEINHRVLSLVADYMTFEGEVKGMNRQDMRSNTSPFHKMSFETTMEFLRSATIHRDVDKLDSNSSRIVMGQPAVGGTGSFDIVARLRNLDSL